MEKKKKTTSGRTPIGVLYEQLLIHRVENQNKIQAANSNWSYILTYVSSQEWCPLSGFEFLGGCYWWLINKIFLGDVYKF